MTARDDARRAIAESIRTDSAPVLRAWMDTAEWVEIVSTLSAKAEDWTIVDSGDSRVCGEVKHIREYRGKDDAGDEWRVHVFSLA